jgi:hypothetical protein
MSQYILIAEFSDKRIGFIIGTFINKNEAKYLVGDIYEEFESYSFNSLLEFSPHYSKKYQSYEITGDRYFPCCNKYADWFCSSNGDLSVSVIRCKGKFDTKAFIEYRNLPKCFGVMMN